MPDLGGRFPRRRADRRGPALAAAALACACVALFAVAAGAARPPVAARAGLDQALAAARVWADDARLVYVENDEDVDGRGAAARWGYLVRSARLGKARAYSVRDGRIVTAEDLAITFPAPPVADAWIDSDAALAAAEAGAGGAFRRDHEGRPGTMLLTRGVFDDGDPDATTWTVVYTSPHAPSLFVVVDAVTGRVRRTWRG